MPRERESWPRRHPHLHSALWRLKKAWCAAAHRRRHRVWLADINGTVLPEGCVRVGQAPAVIGMFNAPDPPREPYWLVRKDCGRCGVEFWRLRALTREQADI